jgi:hypothetical protein
LLCEVVDWWPPKATTNFAFLFFCPKSDGQKDFMASSPIAIALRAVSPKYILTIGPLSVGCCVLPSHPAGAIEIQGPIALAIFISFSLYSPPITTS